MLEDCTVEGNGAQGVLSRDGACPSILRCSIRGNAGFGVLLKDGGGDVRDNTLARERLAAPRSVYVLSLPQTGPLLRWVMCKLRSWWRRPPTRCCHWLTACALLVLPDVCADLSVLSSLVTPKALESARHA